MTKLRMTCDPADVDVLTTGGLSDPKPDAGLLEFNTPGGATELPITETLNFITSPSQIIIPTMGMFGIVVLLLNFEMTAANVTSIPRTYTWAASDITRNISIPNIDLRNF